MSRCITCGHDMDPFDAQKWEDCEECRREGQLRAVRSLYSSEKTIFATFDDVDFEDLIDLYDDDPDSEVIEL